MADQKAVALNATLQPDHPVNILLGRLQDCLKRIEDLQSDITDDMRRTSFTTYEDMYYRPPTYSQACLWDEVDKMDALARALRFHIINLPEGQRPQYFYCHNGVLRDFSALDGVIRELLIYVALTRMERQNNFIRFNDGAELWAEYMPWDEWRRYFSVTQYEVDALANLQDAPRQPVAKMPRLALPSSAQALPGPSGNSISSWIGIEQHVPTEAPGATGPVEADSEGQEDTASSVTPTPSDRPEWSASTEVIYITAIDPWSEPGTPSGSGSSCVCGCKPKPASESGSAGASSSGQEGRDARQRPDVEVPDMGAPDFQYVQSHVYGLTDIAVRRNNRTLLFPTLDSPASLTEGRLSDVSLPGPSSSSDTDASAPNTFLIPVALHFSTLADGSREFHSATLHPLVSIMLDRGACLFQVGAALQRGYSLERQFSYMLSNTDPNPGQDDPLTSHINKDPHEQDDPAAKRDTPAPEQDDATAKRDTPAPDQDDAAAKRDSPAPEQDDTAAKRDTPAPEQDDAAAKRDTPAPKQDDAAAKRDTPPPEQDDAAAKRDTPAPKQDDAAAKRDSPAPKQDDPAAQKSSLYPKQDTPAGQSSSPTPKEDIHLVQSSSLTPKQDAAAAHRATPPPKQNAPVTQPGSSIPKQEAAAAQRGFPARKQDAPPAQRSPATPKQDAAEASAPPPYQRDLPPYRQLGPFPALPVGAGGLPPRQSGPSRHYINYQVHQEGAYVPLHSSPLGPPPPYAAVTSCISVPGQPAHQAEGFEVVLREHEAKRAAAVAAFRGQEANKTYLIMKKDRGLHVFFSPPVVSNEASDDSLESTSPDEFEDADQQSSDEDDNDYDADEEFANDEIARDPRARTLSGSLDKLKTYIDQSEYQDMLATGILEVARVRDALIVGHREFQLLIRDPQTSPEYIRRKQIQLMELVVRLARAQELHERVVWEQVEHRRSCYLVQYKRREEAYSDPMHTAGNGKPPNKVQLTKLKGITNWVRHATWLNILHDFRPKPSLVAGWKWMRAYLRNIRKKPDNADDSSNSDPPFTTAPTSPVASATTAPGSPSAPESAATSSDAIAVSAAPTASGERKRSRRRTVQSVFKQAAKAVMQLEERIATNVDRHTTESNILVRDMTHRLIEMLEELLRLRRQSQQLGEQRERKAAAEQHAEEVYRVSEVVRQMHERRERHRQRVQQRLGGHDPSPGPGPSSPPPPPSPPFDLAEEDDDEDEVWLLDTRLQPRLDGSGHEDDHGHEKEMREAMEVALDAALSSDRAETMGIHIEDPNNNYCSAPGKVHANEGQRPKNTDDDEKAKPIKGKKGKEDMKGIKPCCGCRVEEAEETAAVAPPPATSEAKTKKKKRKKKKNKNKNIKEKGEGEESLPDIPLTSQELQLRDMLERHHHQMVQLRLDLGMGLCCEGPAPDCRAQALLDSLRERHRRQQLALVQSISRELRDVEAEGALDRERRELLSFLTQVIRELKKAAIQLPHGDRSKYMVVYQW